MEILPGDNTILHRDAKTGKLVHVRTMSHPTLPGMMRKQNLQDDTPLHIAARLGHLEFASQLIKKAKENGDIESQEELLKMTNANGDTVLHEAVRNGHYEIVDTIVNNYPESGRWLNKKNESPLFVAFDNMHYQIAILIMEKCPGYEIGGRDDMNALHAFVIRTNPKTQYKAIRDEGEKLITKERYTRLFKDNISAIGKPDHPLLWTPLHYAAFFGYVDVVELVMNDVEKTVALKEDKEGMSALHVACKAGEGKVVKAILKKLPDCADLLDKKHRTGLHLAAKYMKHEVVKVLLDSPSFNDLINARDNEQNTALHLAAAQGNYYCLLILAIDKRVNKVAVNNKGMTALDIIQSSNEIFEFTKTLFARVLELDGARSSLARATLIIDTDNSNVDKKDDEQEREGDKGDGRKKVANPGKGNDKKEDVTENQKSTYFKDVEDVNSVVASLIATVSFTAVAQLPGGYDGDGMVKLGNKSKFKIYMIANALAFTLAASVMFINFVAQIYKPLAHFRVPALRISLLTISAIICMMVAFLTGISTVLEKEKPLDRAIARVEAICLVIVAMYFGIRMQPWERILISIISFFWHRSRSLIKYFKSLSNKKKKD